MTAPKITLRMKHQDRVVSCVLEHEDDVAVRVKEIEACPYCSVSPWWIAGHGKRPSSDDRAYEADAGCIKCRAHVGTLRVEVSTLFGVREDAAVMRMGIRIY